MTGIKCARCGVPHPEGDSLHGLFSWMCSPACAAPAGDWLDEQRRATETLAALQLEHDELKLKLESKGNALYIAIAQRDALRCAIDELGGTRSSLGALADALEPGQSLILGRTSDAQRAELAALEVDGAWAVTVIEPRSADDAGAPQPEEVTLFCGDDRTEAVRRACFYLQGKNGKRGAEPENEP